MDSSKYLPTVFTKYNLSQTVVATVISSLSIFANMSDFSFFQLFLHEHEEMFWYDGFVVIFHIVLRNNTIVVHLLFRKKNQRYMFFEEVHLPYIFHSLIFYEVNCCTIFFFLHPSIYRPLQVLLRFYLS